VHVNIDMELGWHSLIYRLSCTGSSCFSTRGLRSLCICQNAAIGTLLMTDFDNTPPVSCTGCFSQVNFLACSEPVIHEFTRNQD
jgi:hypothetical protein